MEPKDWIAVAQVYATLAGAWSNAVPQPINVDVSGYAALAHYQQASQKIYQYERMARSALRAAGIEDV